MSLLELTEQQKKIRKREDLKLDIIMQIYHHATYIQLLEFAIKIGARNRKSCPDIQPEVKELPAES
ncbi:MAG TPA: hypothetical protein VK152_06750 [Paludibacter sp.]|nr:hypothetical protein [Paludibacter sp.]